MPPVANKLGNNGTSVLEGQSQDDGKSDMPLLTLRTFMAFSSFFLRLVVFLLVA